MATDIEIQAFINRKCSAGSSPETVMSWLLEEYPEVKSEYRKWYCAIENTIDYAFEKQF